MREMGDFNSTERLKAVIVGRCADEFVHYTMDLLGGDQIEIIHLQDIYLTFAWLIKNGQNGNVLVIGRLEQLAAEQGRFLEKVNKNPLTCCCLVNINSSSEQLSAARQAGVVMIDDPAKVKQIVSNCLAERKQQLEKRQNNKNKIFNKGEFSVTRAELDALLKAPATTVDEN